jgi:hypothetical protein
MLIITKIMMTTSSSNTGLRLIFIESFAKVWIVCFLSGVSDAMGPMTVHCSGGHPGPRTSHPAISSYGAMWKTLSTCHHCRGICRSCFGRSNNGYVAASLARNSLSAGCVSCDTRCTYWGIVTNRYKTWGVFSVLKYIKSFSGNN